MRALLLMLPTLSCTLFVNNIDIDATCGNGILQINLDEQCDDGNNVAGDGCDEACLEEIIVEIEPNDAQDIAQPIDNVEVSRKIDGGLFDQFDQDFYQFTLTNTASLSIEITDATAPDGGTCVNDDDSPDTILYLFNAQGIILTEDDDTGVGSCSRMEINRLAPGDYFIRVNDFGFQEPISTYQLSVDVLSLCGDGVIGLSEECDGGSGCLADCTDGDNCGDSILDVGEQCDDANIIEGDGCSNCLIEAGHFFEVEPNDDEQVQEENALLANGDFLLENAGAPFTEDVILHGAMLINGGDEDFFLIQNNTANGRTLTIETADPALGFGGVCDDSCDTTIAVYQLAGDLLGTQIALNDDSVAIGLCSLVEGVAIAPNETLVLQVLESADDDDLLAYLVRVTFQ